MSPYNKSTEALNQEDEDARMALQIPWPRMAKLRRGRYGITGSWNVLPLLLCRGALLFMGDHSTKTTRGSYSKEILNLNFFGDSMKVWWFPSCS